MLGLAIYEHPFNHTFVFLKRINQPFKISSPFFSHTLFIAPYCFRSARAFKVNSKFTVFRLDNLCGSVLTALKAFCAFI